MTNIGRSKPTNYLIHITYAGSFLLAVFLIIGFLVWDKHQAATLINKQIAQKQAEDSAKIIQDHIEIKKQAAFKKEKKIKILECMMQAEKIYSANWAQLCKIHAQEMNDQLDNCEQSAFSIATSTAPYNYNAQNLYDLEIARCKSMIGTPNPQPNCMLPKPIAQRLDKSLENNEKLCKEFI